MAATPITEKQADYLAILSAKVVRECEYLFADGGQTRQEIVIAYALLLALPEPQTAVEASDRIDLLKLGREAIMNYSNSPRNQDWTRGVAERVTALFGYGLTDLPATWDAVQAALASE